MHSLTPINARLRAVELPCMGSRIIEEWLTDCTLAREGGRHDEASGLKTLILEELTKMEQHGGLAGDAPLLFKEIRTYLG